MKRNPLLKILLIVCCLGIHAMLSIHSTSQIVFPYIPPLSHTPGLGVSMLGEHSPPPHMTIQMAQIRLTPAQQQAMDDLYAKQTTQLARGFTERMEMQRLVQALLEQLPPETMKDSLDNRFHHEQRIGELQVWQNLIADSLNRPPL